MVSGCVQLAESLAALGDLDCATAEECSELLASFTTTMERLHETLERSQPTIEREVSDGACRNALIIPEEREALEDVVDALRRFDDAIRSGDVDMLEAAGGDVDEAIAAFDETPSAKELLRNLRAACRPVAS